MSYRSVQVIVLVLVSVPTALQAAVLAFLPAVQSVSVGSPVQVALTVSGLGDGAAPSVGVFDLDLTYDPGILQLNAVSFGDPVLGDQLDLLGLGAVTAVDSSVAGLVNHFELSLDSPGDLDSLQATSFTLSVFSFTALAPGVSALGLTINALGDSLGDSLSASITSGNVTVVPEPATGGLVVALGAIALLGIRRIGNSQR